MKKFLALVTFAAVAAVAADTPRKSPEFIIQMFDGKSEFKDQLLSKYRGKMVVIEFFNPTCPHCQKTVQILQKLYTELGPKGFQPLAIAAGYDHKPLVPNFIKQFGVTFPVGLGDRDPSMAYLKIPNLQQFMVPQIVFIDKQGVIREQHVGGDFKDEENDIRKRVLQYLTAAPISVAPAPAAAPKKAAADATSKK